MTINLDKLAASPQALRFSTERTVQALIDERKWVKSLGEALIDVPGISEADNRHAKKIAAEAEVAIQRMTEMLEAFQKVRAANNETLPDVLE